MATIFEHSGRRFQAMAYHDAIRHDGPALELAEIVDGELGPALLTVLFSNNTTVLLTDSEVPLPILTAFTAAIAQEESRLRSGPVTRPADTATA